jgi:hypothetical protein
MTSDLERYERGIVSSFEELPPRFRDMEEIQPSKFDPTGLTGDERRKALSEDLEFQRRVRALICYYRDMNLID